MDSIPDVQRSWTVICQGTPRKALRLQTDWPVPKGSLSDGEVLVKVQAAGLNPSGWKLMMLGPSFLVSRPHVPEYDFSGVILGENQSGFVPGDSVYGCIPSGVQRITQQGSLSQYVRVPSSCLVKRPSNISPVEAAGITIAALTSYQAIHHIAKVEPEQTVFINGGSSATGAFAIQVAKAKGARVVATASARNEQIIRNLGADEFLDYTQGPLHEYLVQHIPDSKYHVIYDAVGLTDPSLFTWCEKYLAPDGVFISNNPFPKNLSVSELWKGLKGLFAMFVPASLGGVDRRYSVFLTKEDNEDMRAIQELLERGTIKPVVDSVYDFEDAPEAYDRIMSLRAVGKVVSSGMHAFVTVGSTKFDSLVQAVFTGDILSSLCRKGYTNLVVQCGNSTFELASAIQNGDTHKMSRAGVDIEFWMYKPSLQEDYEKADLVISHAGRPLVLWDDHDGTFELLGSGTILDVLRMGKPMIVIPNPTLLDNHQEELASALEELGHLKATTVLNLSRTIEEFDALNIEPFPPFDGSRFARIVDEAMGFI